MRKLLKFSALTSVFLTPTILFAADGISGLLEQVMGVITSLIPIVIAIAVLVFLWGVLQYVVAKDEDKQKEARGVMLYGIIALFVMVSVWGFVNLLGTTIFGDSAGVLTPPPPPGIPGVNSR
jgi:uncharacterized sodium:solute symporter family permease YidK